MVCAAWQLARLFQRDTLRPAWNHLRAVCATQDQGPCGPQAAGASAQSIANAFASLAVRADSLGENTAGKRSSEDSTTSDDDAQPVVDAAQLDTLSALCGDPDIPRDYLAYVLIQRCAGSMEAAACYMLDASASGQLQGLAAGWAGEQDDVRAREQRERVLRHKQKQAVLAK